MSSISIRISDTEKDILNKQEAKAGLTVSNYVRKAIFDKKEFNDNSHQIQQILFGISTTINKFRAFKDIKYLDETEKGVECLWQIL